MQENMQSKVCGTSQKNYEAGALQKLETMKKKEMKNFFRRYGEMLQNSQLDIHELDKECHEMINESLDYALTYLLDWDYRINVPKLKKEVHRLMDLKCLCNLVSRARILTEYYAPNGVVLEELIYRRYCSNIVRTDVEVWQEMGFSRSVYYEKKKQHCSI